MKSKGQIAYEAFYAAGPKPRSWESWDSLTHSPGGEEEMRRWEAAARAVAGPTEPPPDNVTGPTEPPPEQ